MLMQQSTSYKSGRAAGFTAGFALFASILYAVLSLQKKLPAGLEYAHFLAAALILSAAIMLLRRRA